MNDVTMTGIILASCGALILGMAGLLQKMVVGRLDGIQKSIKDLTTTAQDHGEQLVRHETILELNGLTERRKFNRPSNGG
ncbi:hypothetical protein [Mesoterricola silvestris]|uniref:Uncharacterized protein n=1 Tax=Mesoterricola silvestris TaxID=2927979 RepID=A0AA48K910_9BACT|nr:hypothetical protein [Mesoterricola silvestris]BDU72921.1 hypothetical protein METEAL_20950 [Mesoterricola silvestris]